MNNNLRLSKRFICEFNKSLSDLDSVQLVKFYTLLEDLKKFTLDHWHFYQQSGSVSLVASNLIDELSFRLRFLYFEELRKRGLINPCLTGTELAEFCCNCLSVENPSEFLDSFFGSFKNGRHDVDVIVDLNSKEIL